MNKRFVHAKMMVHAHGTIPDRLEISLLAEILANRCFQILSLFSSAHRNHDVRYETDTKQGAKRMEFWMWVFPKILVTPNHPFQ